MGPNIAFLQKEGTALTKCSVDMLLLKGSEMANVVGIGKCGGKRSGGNEIQLLSFAIVFKSELMHFRRCLLLIIDKWSIKSPSFLKRPKKSFRFRLNIQQLCFS